MIIDSSALVAIVLREPDFDRFISRISAAPFKLISAASMLETSIVVNRAKGAAGIAVLRRFIADAGIRVVALNADHADIAFSAHQRFGKGMGHPAQLNILDCCSYALAAGSGDALLFKGSDFDKTDAQIAP